MTVRSCGLIAAFALVSLLPGEVYSEPANDILPPLEKLATATATEAELQIFEKAWQVFDDGGLPDTLLFTALLTVGGYPDSDYNRRSTVDAARALGLTLPAGLAETHRVMLERSRLPSSLQVRLSRGIAWGTRMRELDGEALFREYGAYAHRESGFAAHVAHLLLDTAATRNHPAALYEKGTLMIKEDAGAKGWRYVSGWDRIEKAARLGSAPAQRSLARQHQQLGNQPQHLAAAAYWYNRLYRLHSDPMIEARMVELIERLPLRMKEQLDEWLSGDSLSVPPPY